MCDQRLAGGPLLCTRTDAHATGHTYESTSGVPDRHDLPESEQPS